MELLKKLMDKINADGIVLTDLKNIRYFTGFTGSSALCFYTKKEAFFITDFRYKEQSENEIKGWEIIIEKKKFNALKKLIKKLKLKKIAFESTISFEHLEILKKFKVKLSPIKKEILKLREIKTAGEIERIKKAIKLAEDGFLKIKEMIRPGVMERDIAVELEYRMKKLGSGRLPFEVIVASGENSALPHARSSMRKLQPNDIVLIDWGAEAEGYYSDMTRTFLIKGNNSEEKRKIYRIVKEAQERAIRTIRPGVTTREIDRAARQYIEGKGYGKSFGHSTGHGVGLDIHELPTISISGKERLKPGMVFTVEPGIYLSGMGGVRIEDMVLVTDRGVEVLTNLPKELEEL
ncbi:MAG: Xaa-Pro peptidase family protein [Thermodesulfovibrionales bacterium]|nr:Xaa-Pro peptidase family protein [Thermodesulfovibrionales bacterium]